MMVYIKRLQIEEGFLDGLDITFSSGLNTIIGARGTGKSSVLELIRFCLGVKNYSEETRKRSYEHALSVLGGGQVIVTLRAGEHEIVVTRSADDAEPDATATYTKPMIFSQSEIERVGLQASSRMKLIDGFTKESDRLQKLEAESKAVIRSLTADVSSIKGNIDDLEGQLGKLSELKERLQTLSDKEKEVAGISKEANQKAKSLDLLSENLANLGVETDQFTVFQEELVQTKDYLESAIESLPVSDEDLDSKHVLAKIYKKLEPIQSNLRNIIADIDNIDVEVGTLIEKNSEKKRKDNESARKLRASIEEMQKGAGAIVREGQKIREQVSKLETLNATIQKKKLSLDKLIVKRNSQLDQLERISDQRFNDRLGVEKKLNRVLSPQIKINVLQAGNIENYGLIISEYLKGSGIQYKNIVGKIAESVSPRELLEFAGNMRIEDFAEILGLSSDRAGKILLSLNTADLGDLATVDVEDTVSFCLLDGGDYKDFTELSTGQRCTVVLPIILEHLERVVIIDQPEDHIDNAFITNTLIKAILRRADQGQVILTTHNANIPVLGNAATVIQMGSDGDRGYLQARGPLSDFKIIEAISNVMEGGSEAFKRRADFYEILELLS